MNPLFLLALVALTGCASESMWSPDVTRVVFDVDALCCGGFLRCET